MRIVLIGPGAVGGVVGGRLFQFGHDVVLVARGAHREAIAERGLTVEWPEGSVTLPIPVVGSPAELTFGPDDVVIVAVKSQDTAGVIDAAGRRRPAVDADRVPAERRGQRGRLPAPLRQRPRRHRDGADVAPRAGRRARLHPRGRRDPRRRALARWCRRRHRGRGGGVPIGRASSRSPAPTSRGGSTPSCCSTSATRSTPCARATRTSGRCPSSPTRRGRRCCRRPGSTTSPTPRTRPAAATSCGSSRSTIRPGRARRRGRAWPAACPSRSITSPARSSCSAGCTASRRPVNTMLQQATHDAVANRTPPGTIPAATLLARL